MYSLRMHIQLISLYMISIQIKFNNGKLLNMVIWSLYFFKVCIKQNFIELRSILTFFLIELEGGKDKKRIY